MDDVALRIIIKETVEQTLERLGFTVDAPHAIQADMIFIRKSREGSEEIHKWIRRTAVGIAVSGVLYSLWKGLKQEI